MRDHSEANITQAVLKAFSRTADPRLKTMMSALVTHLHAFARDVQLTPEEWWMAVEFLRSVGKICTDDRNEFILMSDIFGLSMLVDGLANRFPPGATPSTIIGPFYSDKSKRLPMGARIGRPEDGVPCVVSGLVRSTDGSPIEGAILDVWQTDEDGMYDIVDPNQPIGNLRGTFETGTDGHYKFIGVKPKGYEVPVDGPGGRILEACSISEVRPAHIHFMIKAKGHLDCGTHVFVEGDPAIDSDPVFGTKNELIVPFRKISDPREAEREGIDGEFWRCDFDFVMTPVR